MRHVAFALILVALSGCTSVQTRVRGELLVSTDTYDGPPQAFELEVVESHDLSPLMLSCVVTGIFMGGTCWAYLAAPYGDQQAVAVRHAEDATKRIGRCTDLIAVKVEHAGWGSTRRRVEVRSDGVTLSDREALQLCAKPPPSQR